MCARLSPAMSRERFLAVVMGLSRRRSSGLLRRSLTFCFSRERSFRLGSEATQRIKESNEVQFWGGGVGGLYAFWRHLLSACGRGSNGSPWIPPPPWTRLLFTLRCQPAASDHFNFHNPIFNYGEKGWRGDKQTWVKLWPRDHM